MDKYAQNLAVAQADLERASAAVSEADRQFVAALERLHFQRARLADTRIYAPFDGLITRRDRDVGDIVVPGAAIFKLVSLQEMWVSAWIDETAMAALAKGQSARVVFRSEPKRNYEGKVSRIGSEVDRETREFLVDVGVEVLPQNWAVRPLQFHLSKRNSTFACKDTNLKIAAPGTTMSPTSRSLRVINPFKKSIYTCISKPRLLKMKPFLGSFKLTMHFAHSGRSPL